ncbi:uncharacterized protein K441DRAFT_175892 [Cenococcum geophilum 1.58]|uniref:uncharacterized protein n=1 Tax=Cenococcum geophilum 1.58 TaxID=794803 RepID=UPI00358F991F|nr:hypothetical protein K441DRAFT_175892 [Cenococcum geophilum 1.58]
MRVVNECLENFRNKSSKKFSIPSLGVFKAARKDIARILLWHCHHQSRHPRPNCRPRTRSAFCRWTQSDTRTPMEQRLRHLLSSLPPPMMARSINSLLPLASSNYRHLYLARTLQGTEFSKPVTL